jgi:GNAT superfamily N-acetyltransferase
MEDTQIVEFETANLDDFDEIFNLIEHELYLDSIKDVEYLFFHEPKYIRRFIRKGTVIKASIAGRIIGVLGYASEPLNKYMMILDFLCVDKAFQGHGIGSRLVNIFVNICESTYTIKDIIVSSFVIYGVKDFYIKQGFEECDFVEEYTDKSGTIVPRSLIFKKSLF